jgi:hypothetical protein
VINKAVVCIGLPYDAGDLQGRILGREIRRNIAGFRKGASPAVYSWEKMFDIARIDKARLTTNSMLLTRLLRFQTSAIAI